MLGKMHLAWDVTR